MVCFALACQCHALPLPCGASLCLAAALSCLAVPLPCRRRRAKPSQGIAMPSRVYVWPCRRMVEHFHAPASQRPAIAARTAPCLCGSMRRPAPQSRSCASPPLCRAFDALPPPTSALLCNAAAVRPNPQPLLCQSSPPPCRPCTSLAVLSQAMPLRCSAPLCRSRACPCFPLPSPLGPLP